MELFKRTWFILIAAVLGICLFAGAARHVAAAPQIAAGAAHGTQSGSETQQSPTKAEFAQKTGKLRIPFIANNGQVDEQVKFYAKNTKEGILGGMVVRANGGSRRTIDTFVLGSL